MIDGAILDADAFLFEHPFVGTGSISASGQNAVTQIEGVPTSLRVLIMDAGSFEMAFVVESAADGTWTVNNVDANRQYIALCRHPTKTLNSQVLDWIDPE